MFGSLPQYRISIHAPREGSDRLSCHADSPSRHFNPRSPRGERPGSNSSAETCAIYFNPRSPRGERQVDADALADAQKFQSTLPARGATGVKFLGGNLRNLFQSTLPARGATSGRGRTRRRAEISIHAPREGSDLALDVVIFDRTHFNPRSPRGERRSRYPMRKRRRTISIHAPREGSDKKSYSAQYTARKFQSTLPARGATSVAPVL